MAKKVVETLIDDLDGVELREGEGQTVRFSLNNSFYEMDLSNKNAKKLEDLLEPFIAKARADNTDKQASPTSSGPDPALVRQWAADQGIEVNSRGRLRLDVIEKYLAARK